MFFLKFYFNIFNDYGLIWENKTKPTQNDNSLRSSAGFGIKYYSPIGPIGLTWGFPIMEEDYERIRAVVREGKHTQISASKFSKINRILVPNTAGASGAARTTYVTDDGVSHEVKQRKWNLKRELVKEILDLHLDGDLETEKKFN